MERNKIESYKLERTSYVDAVYYDGDNEDEIVILVQDNGGRNISFSKTELVIKKTHQGNQIEEEVSVLLLAYQDKKSNFKKITIHEGMFFVTTARGFKVMENEKFLEKYTYIER